MAEPTKPAVVTTAMWLWQMPDDPDVVLEFVRRHGLAEVYVEPSGPRVGNLVDRLRGAGVTASCLGGDPKWAVKHDAGLRWCEQSLARADFVGVHLDIEPWALPEWKAAHHALAAGYAELIEAVAAAVSPVAVDIVPWLFRIEPGASARVVAACDALTVLAYRDHALGPTGIVAASSAARAACGKAGRRYRIGVETQRVSDAVPPEVTFADDGVAAMEAELVEVQRALSADPRFDGVAIHHWASSLELLSQTTKWS